MGEQVVADEDGLDVAMVVGPARPPLHHRIADRFREGRILLAGDAAHVDSSASGQGMNTCIQDAYALGALLAGGRIGAMH